MGRPRTRLFGVGINDIPNATSGVFYRYWNNMIRRCYSELFKQKYPTYRDVTCCEEWLTFSNFKRWMEQQDWEGKQLDKDLLVYRNRVYSPETCCFVSKSLNVAITYKSHKSSSLPVGVYWNKKDKRFQAQMGTDVQARYLGQYLTQQEAHRCWQKAKISAMINLLDNVTDGTVIKGLNRIINKIQNDYNNNLETEDF